MNGNPYSFALDELSVLKLKHMITIFKLKNVIVFNFRKVGINNFNKQMLLTGSTNSRVKIIHT